MTGIRYRKDIDGLRCLAVLPVVLNHAGLSFIPGGFVGVDIFFVISGFLITGILAREIDEGRFSILNFYERRVRRILPALILVLIATFAGGYFILLPSEFVDLSKSAIATMFFASNIWFWRASGDYFADGTATEPLLHTWSLAVEEQFYLFFPILLLLIASQPRKVWWIIVGGLSLGSLVLSIAITQSYPTINFYMLPTRIWELGIGALIAIGAVPAAKSQSIRNAASVLGIALIIASVLLITEHMPFPGLTAIPPCLGAALIIWAGREGETLGGKWISIGPIVWFGLISYSLYLWHWPIIVGARILTGEVLLETNIALVCIALSIALAWLSWRFVERPFRNSKEGFWQARWRIFGAGGGAMAAIIGVAGVIWLINGVPQRMPQDEYARYAEAKTRTPIERSCTNRRIGSEPCVIGADNATISYVVWGDSHAASMLPGFDAVFAREGEGAVAFTKTACAPLPGLWRVDQGPDHRCDDFNANVASQIAENYSEATIILAGRWGLATRSERAEGEDGGAGVLARTGQQSDPSQSNANLVSESLDTLLSELTARGHRVVLLGSIPEQGVNFPRMEARDALLGRPLNREPTALGAITRSSYEERNALWSPIMDAAARDYPVRTVQLRDILCEGTCLIRNEGQHIYRDDDHLSPYGAELVVSESYAAISGQ